jgi:hypothetical protein
MGALEVGVPTLQLLPRYNLTRGVENDQTISDSTNVQDLIHREWTRKMAKHG